MSLVDYGSSDDEVDQENEVQSTPARSAAASVASTASTTAPKTAAIQEKAVPTGPRQVNLTNLIGKSQTDQRTEQQAQKQKRKDFFFRTEENPESDEEDKRAKRVHKAAALADILPAPKNRSSAAAAVRLPMPIRPAVQMQTFDDQIEEEILNHKLPDAQSQQTGQFKVDLGGSLDDVYGQAQRTAKPAPHSAGYEYGRLDNLQEGEIGTEDLEDASMPAEFREHLRTGSAKVYDIKQSDLRKQPFLPHAAQGGGVGPTIAAVHAPGSTAKRTHQITFLAFSARELETQLEMKRASSSKNKAQTASKYGW